MAKSNGPLMNSNNNDQHYEALAKWQTMNDQTNDIFRHYAFLIGPTVAAQHDDGGLLVHDTAVRRGDHNHSNRSYIICFTKTGPILKQQTDETEIN